MQKPKIWIWAMLVLGITLTGFSSTNQLFKTSLRITVLNDLGNIEEGVKVNLYKNKEDYQASENVVQTGYTDSKGRVTFKDLEAMVYWIEAIKGDKNNYGGGEKTERLEENKMNKVNIVIE